TVLSSLQIEKQLLYKRRHIAALLLCLLKEPESAINAAFPDLSGSISAGATAEEAFHGAREAAQVISTP
ncbi:MAG: hypothetical protein D6757_04750, partial [Alphaproteobacteria bacterium]